ncbi:hypothetical protein SCAR479_09906 [Seiridium cardinale]|uniref:Uncharacterized protein n=1 Tax=Seiridium cardinale TaxID=138064 RepID=A0ABR2XHU4_9PEZI
MNSSEADLPPPPGPSKTFSIDFSMPAEEEPAASFDELREQHESFLDGLVPSSEEEEDPSTIPASSGQAFSFASLSTPASAASPGSRPMVSLGIKPQFNLDSAQNLLQTFRGMLPSCPCIVLGEGANVKTMARDSPFVLLAILAATSCSTSLQGHSLYDEEFRKVLGLKFVTGGERTLDLLQGILVYCAWYPFHLRPKHRQAFQYLKMAIDIAHDLELDQEQAFAAQLQTGPNLEDLASFRALVSCYYLITNFSNAFSRVQSFPFTAWLSNCCDLLEQYSNIEQDHVLVWLIRLHHISDEMLVLQKGYKKAGSGSELHRQLIRKGLETQLREWQSRIPTSIALMPSVMMASLFDDMHLIAAPLMLTVVPRSASADVPLDPTGLMEAVHTVRAFFEFIVSLPPGAMSQFCSADWVRVIVANILGYRLCLPIEICPEFDSAQARQIFDFGSYLEKLCGDPTECEAAPGGKKTDVCTAFRVVLRSLKAKFEKKLAAAIAKEEIKRKAQECPMFDGSLDDYIYLWDGHDMPAGSSSYPTSQSSTSGVLTEAITDLSPGTTESAKSSVYHDLWATMTLGWSAEDMPDLGMSNAQMDW